MEHASPVCLIFPADKGDDYAEAREELINSLLSWAAVRRRQPSPFALIVALDRRFETDGHLARWRSDDIRTVLLDWFPRKVTMAEPERSSVVPTLHLLVDYLVARRLLEDGSADPAELHRTLDQCAPEFLAAMADPSRYDVAKFWTTRMLDDGVDLDDPTAVNQFIAAAQAGAIDFDQAVVESIMRRQFPSGEHAEKDELELPPVRLPTAAELLPAAEASPVVGQVVALVRWVGAGRTLTKAGRLTLADGRDLARVLDTDSVYLIAARSSADLPTVSLVLSWARAAKLVRVVKGRLVPVKRAAPLLRQPVELWQRLFTAFGELGEQLCAGSGGIQSWLATEFDEVLPVLWMALYAGGGAPIPTELVHGVVRDELAGAFGFGGSFGLNPAFGPGLGHDALVGRVQEQLWRRDVNTIVEVLAAFGAVRQETVGAPEQLVKITEVSEQDDPDPTLVQLTPLGLWAVHRMLQDEGITVPVVGDLSDATMDVLFRRLKMADPEAAQAELAAWVAARGAEPAAAELVTYISKADEASQRLLGFLALGQAGAAGLAAAAGLRASGGVAGALAAGWLMERDGLGTTAITPTELELGLADSLAAMCEQGFLIDELASQSTPDQLQLVRRLGTIDHPSRLAILDKIATDHPDRKVAKQAGRIRLRLRTADVNR